MEHLDILEKIYQYGETLSSEEMNQIVSRLNIIINSVNTIIRNNNGISAGHCEMRYILSPQQPIKPETGTDGLSNGWSNLYLLPEIGSGNSTWMSLCFVSGEDTYGEWSAPVCIYSGTMSGQQGPKGDSGETGAFVSRVFKRQNTKPDTPVGGTYNYPIPDGWFDGVPEGQAIIWSSTATFYGNGTQTDWSEPAQESDTDTLDIEFSPSATQPPAPLGNTPYSNHEAEGWFDPNSPNFSSAGIMIWRAERKVSNGEYNGDWTITRIFGEKGENGLKGDTGGHYEFRYNNFKATEDQPTPIKPADGSDGTANGWKRNQEDLTELEIKEGMFTWMTQCYLDENGVYQTWSEPIRITGANGIDGEDGTEQEFMYTRNNTGEFPPAPPTTQKNEAALFNELGEWTDPISGITWTDDPRGVNDEIMWEFVTTRIKEGTIWGPFSTPVIWAKWGKQGRIGQMSYLAGIWNPNTEYIKTAERNPVVFYDNDYFYLIGELTFEGVNKNITEITSIGQNPRIYTDVWAKAENYEMVFTDILFVNDFAKLATFIINRDWMLSKHGTLYYRNNGQVYTYDVDDNTNITIGGTNYTSNSAYIQFDPNSPNGYQNAVKNPNFVPAMAIDGLSGRCFFWKGYFQGDVKANSLYLGNTNMSTKLDNIDNSLARKLEADDVKVVSDGINKQVTVGNRSYNVINGGDFLLTNVGMQGDGYYFKVSTKGLLEAHNAIVYGTIVATSGSFSGDVYANAFRAGNPDGLNITVTGDSINFNKGSNTCAWFSTINPSGSNSDSLYLYIKNPSNGQVYTLDFSNLTAVNGGGAVANQQTSFYDSITDSNYKSNLFTSSADSYYYSDSGLSSKYSGTLYQKVNTGWAIILYNGRYMAQQNVGFFKKVEFNNGSISSISSNYWASTSINGSIVSLQGTTSTAPDANQIDNLGVLGFNKSGVYYATVGQGSGGKITRCQVQTGPNFQTLVGMETYDMHS